jgi:N-dimethylarginine dimethylaminohydrolase
VTITSRAYGAQSMTADLAQVLVSGPGRAFGRAYEMPWCGFLRPVDLDRACREHDALVDALTELGVTVRVLDEPAGNDDPDLACLRPAADLRPRRDPAPPRQGNRAGEPAVLEAWATAAGIPTAGRIEAPGTIEGGDTFWLRPDLLCIGRTLRTNDAGARQLAEIVGGDVRMFDVPYWKGPAELVHLLSVVSPVADDLAVVTCRSCRWACGTDARPGHPARRGPGRVPDAGLQRAAVRPGWRSSPTATRSRGAPRGGGCGSTRSRPARSAGTAPADRRALTRPILRA